MRRRLDQLWLRMLDSSLRWIVRRLHNHCQRTTARAEAQRREPLRRLERHLATQKPHLN